MIAFWHLENPVSTRMAERGNVAAASRTGQFWHFRVFTPVGSSGNSTGWRRWREVRMGAKRVVESAIHIQLASFQILGQLLARRLRVDRRGVQ